MIGTVAAVIVGAVVGFVLHIVVSRGDGAEQPREQSLVEGMSMSELLHQVIHDSPTAVVVVDRSERVVLSNVAAHELGVVYERSLSRVGWGAALAVFADGAPRQVDLTPPSSTRRSKPLFSVTGVARLVPGETRYVVIYARDESEMVRMENARRDFVANVSHELKTPAGAISLLAEALQESKDDPDSVDYFARSLVSETQKMSNLIAELIALSKLQGAEPLPDVKEVSVDDIVDEAVKRCLVNAQQHEIRLSSDGPSGAVVMGDRALLITALTNLITNAINYSPEATPVTVTRAVNGSTVSIRVTDRGIGIAPEHQKRVFERFYRVDEARSRHTGGTGLGLAIVKHVAQNHGGRVKLWSKPDTGSTFTMELPAAPGHEEPTTQKAER